MIARAMVPEVMAAARRSRPPRVDGLTGVFCSFIVFPFDVVFGCGAVVFNPGARDFAGGVELPGEDGGGGGSAGVPARTPRIGPRTARPVRVGLYVE